METFSSLWEVSFDKNSTCVALGLFDGLHAGHMKVIDRAVQMARSLGRRACVFTFAMNGASPAGKSPLRLLTFTSFKRQLDEAGVDCIVRPDFAEFKDMPPHSFVNDILIGRLGAAFVSCGENFRFGKGASAAAGDMEKLGGECLDVCVIPMFSINGEAVSSSKIRELIEKGDMSLANAMLGRRFSIDFEVVHGRELGRTLGAPTINQPIPDPFVVPRFGVYSTIAKIDERWYSSVTNVGVKPTVGSDYVLAETYIHGFSGDLYGRRVQVDFLSFIRPEMKFKSIDELKSQILRDSKVSNEISKSSLSGLQGMQSRNMSVLPTANNQY